MGFSLGGILGKIAAPIISPIVGGLLGSKGAEKSAKAAQSQLNNQISFLQDVYDTGVRGYEPYQEVGGEGLGVLKDILLGGDMSKFYQSPDYQFRLDEGNRAISNMLAKGGLRNSTAALRNATQYGQNLASQEYQNFLKNIFGLTNVGTAGLDAITNLGTNIGGLRTGTINSLANVGAAKAGAPYTAASNVLGQLSSPSQALGNKNAFEYLLG